jgi:hypothetical protein
VSHLGISVDTRLDTVAELHRHGVKLVIHDDADGGATVEAGGLLVAADLLVEARRRYRAEAIRAGQIRSNACGTRVGRSRLPIDGGIRRLRDGPVGLISSVDPFLTHSVTRHWTPPASRQLI